MGPGRRRSPRRKAFLRRFAAAGGRAPAERAASRGSRHASPTRLHGLQPTWNGDSGMESWLIDARFAARRLRARPAYALLAVLTLALGVGGTAAVYGIARPFLLDPLPYHDESRLVAFWSPFS